MRWLVERRTDVFEDYGFDSVTVLDCGALKFHNGSIIDPRDITILAPGQWISVCEGED